MARITVDSRQMPWENGLEVVRRMAPAFRDNLGPVDQVEALFALYDQKTLFHDPATTRRIDLIDVKPGYRDLTNAFHDSVEECLVLDGALHLDGEGDLVAGDYFWRPPGFVHAAATAVGFRALLGFQGDDPAEGSGPTSRRICPDDLAGTNQLFRDEPDRAVGPRGWVRRLPSALLPWIPGPIWSRRRDGQLATWGIEQVEVRILSENERCGGQTVLVRLLPGWRAGATVFASSLDLYVLEGSMQRSGVATPAGTFLHLPAGEPEDGWSSPTGALVYLRTDGLPVTR